MSSDSYVDSSDEVPSRAYDSGDSSDQPEGFENPTSWLRVGRFERDDPRRDRTRTFVPRELRSPVRDPHPALSLQFLTL